MKTFQLLEFFLFDIPAFESTSNDVSQQLQVRERIVSHLVRRRNVFFYSCLPVHFPFSFRGRSFIIVILISEFPAALSWLRALLLLLSCLLCLVGISYLTRSSCEKKRQALPARRTSLPSVMNLRVICSSLSHGSFRQHSLTYSTLPSFQQQHYHHYLTSRKQSLPIRGATANVD